MIACKVVFVKKLFKYGQVSIIIIKYPSKQTISKMLKYHTNNAKELAHGFFINLCTTVIVIYTFN